MHYVHQQLSLIGCPYMVVGDFNMEPQQLLQTDWDVAHKGIIVGPNVERTNLQLNGRYIDYCIASHQIHNIMGEPRAIYQVPFRPHIAVEYIIKGNPRKTRVPTFKRPGQMPPKANKSDLDTCKCDYATCLQIAQDMQSKPTPHPKQITDYVATLPNPQQN